MTQDQETEEKDDAEQKEAKSTEEGKEEGKEEKEEKEEETIGRLLVSLTYDTTGDREASVIQRQARRRQRRRRGEARFRRQRRRLAVIRRRRLWGVGVRGVELFDLHAACGAALCSQAWYNLSAVPKSPAVRRLREHSVNLRASEVCCKASMSIR